MEMESVFLDNLPDTANMILNILWDKNEEMCTAELTEAVNEVYNRRWEKGLIQEFINLLIRMAKLLFMIQKRKSFLIQQHTVMQEQQPFIGLTVHKFIGALLLIPKDL